MATTQTDRTGGPAASIATDREQGLVSGVGMKGPCYLATTDNITLAGVQTIDGVSATAGKRVLVKDQADATQNGIYVVATGDWVRAPDFFSNDSVREGTRVFVTDGTVNMQTEFVVTTSDSISVGTTSITFALSSTVQAAGMVAEGLPAAIAAASDVAFDDADFLIARQTSSGLVIKRTWANVKAAIWTALGGLINGGTIKATPVDADSFPIKDSQSSNATKQVSMTALWANYLKDKADALYQPLKTILTTLGNLANSAGYLRNDGAGVLSWGSVGVTLLTEQATTSGTTVDFTIPSGAKRITIMLNGVSFSSAVKVGVQIGDSGGIENTGYEWVYGDFTDGDATVGTPSSLGVDTTKFNIGHADASANLATGTVTLCRINATHTWLLSGVIYIKNGGTFSIVPVAGAKTLSAELTTVRLMNGTFDAGSVNVMWE